MTMAVGGRSVPWRVIGWGSVAVLLSIPAVAGAPWTASDYVFAAALLGSVGLGLEVAARWRNGMYMLGAGIALVAALMLVWINAAVGVIGGEGNPANLAYLAVIGVAAIGAVIAEGRPFGMACAMGAAATMLLMLAAVVLAAGLGGNEPPGRWGVLAFNLVFTGVFASSAAAFAMAARR